jgi:cytochrome b involved in lipid metabolism
MNNKYIYLFGVVVICIVGYFFYESFNEEKNVEDFANENVSATTTNATTSIKYYTLAEISVHNNRTDCWMVINGDVLNTTDFISKHPGGERILEGCGKDATPLFNQIPGHATKSVIKLLMKKMKIGELQG